MNAVWGMSLTALIVIALVVGWATLLKFVAYRVHTRDGDSFGNRLAGRGPDDELGPPSARDEWNMSTSWFRRDPSDPSGSGQH